jgi:hypothetical protein
MQLVFPTLVHDRERKAYMAVRWKIALAAFGAALVLASAVGVASAGRFSITNRTFRVTWSPITYTGGGIQVECNVTIEGSFHSTTIQKVVGTLVGYVTRAAVTHPCTEGAWYYLNGVEVLRGVTLSNTLPWHIRYRSFVGALPNIQKIGLDIIDYSFLIETVLIPGCLYRSTAARPVQWDFVREGGGAITSVEEPAVPIPLKEGVGCPSELTFAGAGRLMVPGTTLAIRVTLI